MDSLDQIVAQFVEPSGSNHRLLPAHITLGAVNKDGTFEYVKSYGGGNDKNIEQPSGDPIYGVASCTKLITTIAVLQCVEKGLLELDDDISKVLKEWGNPKVLIGFDKSGDPIMEDSKDAITLRQLLTHSSGMAYGFENMHPDLARFQKLRNRKTFEGRTIEESFEPILIHHPGKQWEYSPAIDWAGKMVERVNGNMKLGEYMQRHIFDPLGIKDMAFSVSDRQDMQCRLVQCWERSETEGLKKGRWSMRPQPAEEHFGGGGLYASATDLLKIYRAILQKNGRILGEEMVSLMFMPQLQHTAGLDNLSSCPPYYRNSILNSVPSSTPINFGLGGLVNLQHVAGRRGSHSLTWSGTPNCYWWIDPQNGIAGVYLSQLLPPGEPEAVALLSKFEETVYSFVAGKLHSLIQCYLDLLELK